MKIITFAIPAALVLVIGALVVSYSPSNGDDDVNTEDVQTTTVQNYQNITAEEFASIIETNDPFIVDTHIPEQEHISGTDTFIPYTEIEAHVNDLPEDKD